MEFSQLYVKHHASKVPSSRSFQPIAVKQLPRRGSDGDAGADLMTAGVCESEAFRSARVSGGTSFLSSNEQPNGLADPIAKRESTEISAFLSNSIFAAVKPLGYNGSKAILNMLTVQLAWELRDTPIKVNAVNPGYTATDMNDNAGTQTLQEGAAETVRQALAADDAPTGGFFQTGSVVPW